MLNYSFKQYTPIQLHLIVGDAMEAKKAFLMFLLFGALSFNTLVHAKQPHRKVLILGAGLSGIIAGKTLQDSGIDDFLILEGQDYIGGRIKQVWIAFSWTLWVKHSGSYCFNSFG